MDDNKNSPPNRSYHRPIWDDDGTFHYKLVPQPKDKNHTSVCLVPPTKVIPVIFIPGVMGSNLKSGDKKVWQFSLSSLKNGHLLAPKKESNCLIRRPPSSMTLGKF